MNGEEISNHDFLVRAWYLNQDSYSNDRKPDPVFLSLIRQKFPDVTVMWNNRVQRWAVMKIHKFVHWSWYEELPLGVQLEIPRRLFFWQDEMEKYMDLDNRIIEQLQHSQVNTNENKKILKEMEN